MPYGFFRRQGFRTIIFERQDGPFQNFRQSWIMVKWIGVSFSDPVIDHGQMNRCIVFRPRATPRGPLTPNPKQLFFCVLGPHEQNTFLCGNAPMCLVIKEFDRYIGVVLCPSSTCTFACGNTIYTHLKHFPHTVVLRNLRTSFNLT